MTISYDFLKADIVAKLGGLSPRLRQVAEFALRNPDVMALETVAETAARAGVPPSSLIRFANAVGYDGFTSLQRVFRSRLVERTSDYAERIAALGQAGLADTPGAILDSLTEVGIGALERLRSTVRPESFELAADLLAGADAIHVIAQRRSFPIAAYLAYAFAQLPARAQLLDGVAGMLSQQVDFVARGDVLIAVSFDPYAPETVSAARRVAERGVPVVAITDGPLSPLIPLARVAFEVEEAELEGFRSLSTTMCLALALVIRLGQRLAKEPASPAARRKVRPHSPGRRAVEA